MAYNPQEAANMVTGSIQQGARGIYDAWKEEQPVSAPIQERLDMNVERAQRQDNTAEKWLNFVHAGTMTPQEAATRARLERQGHPGAYAGMDYSGVMQATPPAQVSPQASTQGGNAPQGSAPLYDFGGATQYNPAGSSAGGDVGPRPAMAANRIAQTSPAVSRQVRPNVTYGDLAEMEKMGPLLRQPAQVTDTPEARMMRAYIANQGKLRGEEMKQTGASERAGVKSSTAKEVANIGANAKKDVASTTQGGALQRAKLKFTTDHDKLSNNLEVAAMKMKTALSVAQIRGNTSEAMQAVRAALGEMDKLGAQAAKLASVPELVLSKDPDTLKRIADIHQKMDELAPLVKQAQDVAKSKMSQRPVETTSTRATTSQPAPSAIEQAAKSGLNTAMQTRLPTAADLNAMFGKK